MNTGAGDSTGQLPQLKLLDRASLQDIMAAHIKMVDGDVNILEAGCGRKWPFQKQKGHTITGIDMDSHALEVRRDKQKDLDVAVLGDLRKVELPARSFDIIYSAFVLEHIDGARKVMDNFLSWLKPGGLLLLTFPNRDSVYGFCTRFTPFWFHVFYKKYIEGIKGAGKPGFAPYETYHDEIISRRSFLEYATAMGLTVREEYGFSNVPKLVRAFMRVIGGLSFGKLASDHVNLMYVLEKRA